MVGGMVDVIRDDINGRLVEPFDGDALTQAILDLLLSPAVRRHSVRSRRDMVEHGALDVQAQHYEALFERMRSNVDRLPPTSSSICNRRRELASVRSPFPAWSRPGPGRPKSLPLTNASGPADSAPRRNWPLPRYFLK